ncbi:glycosyltransferase family 2 protein [Geodermatophilus sp. SYSU D00079]
MSQPLVSILIPTYNGERFLRPALRSALEQTHRNVEVLVGDDASTDRTPDVLAEFQADPRVRVLRYSRNIGAFENPRRLLAEARGEYVKFLLHDDVLASDCVRDLVKGMQSAGDVTLAFSHRSFIGDDGRPLPNTQPKPFSDKAGPVDGVALGDLVLGNCTNVIGELTTVLFRRADVAPDELWEADGRQLAVLGDVGLFLRLLTRGRAYYSPRTLSRFRIHGGQRSQGAQMVPASVRDWVALIDWAGRQGFLAAEGQERRAHVEALAMASGVLRGASGSPHGASCLEALFLSVARLTELETGTAADIAQPLADRAHRPESLRRFRQEVDVWSRRLPRALAAPAPDAAEVTATIDAFRELRDAGRAEQFLLATHTSLVDETVPLVEAALDQGPDVDVELVPTDEDPSLLLPGPWLAVTPRRDGPPWHRGRATAVWHIDLSQATS